MSQTVARFPDPLVSYGSPEGAPPMIVQQIGSNMTEVQLADGTCILVSYTTPVAALVPGKGWIRTEHKWSSTTTKHINKWLAKNCGGTVTSVPQWEVDQLLAF